MSLKPDIHWGLDADNQQVFGGPLLKVFCRTYVPGWNDTCFMSEAPSDTQPSARCTIMLRAAEGGSRIWHEQEFTADTMEEVKSMVEFWTQAKFDQLRDLIIVN